MKKIILANVIVLVLGMILTGCVQQVANKPIETAGQTAELAPTPEPKPTPAPAPTATPEPEEEKPYREATALLELENYKAALEIFSSLGGYKDSAQKAQEIEKWLADNLMNKQPLNVDEEYLKKLRENAVEVSTSEEFIDAVETAYIISIKESITLDINSLSLRKINVLLIEEGVKLTVTSANFHPDCGIVNLGEILVDGGGRMIFYSEPDYNHIGEVYINGKNGQICFNAGKIKAKEIAYLLGEDSMFNSLNIVASKNGKNFVEILIDSDIVIPAGKEFWINSDSVLRVKKGVTLTNNGAIECYNEPIIEGEIDGLGKLVVN